MTPLCGTDCWQKNISNSQLLDTHEQCDAVNASNTCKEAIMAAPDPIMLESVKKAMVQRWLVGVPKQLFFSKQKKHINDCLRHMLCNMLQLDCFTRDMMDITADHLQLEAEAEMGFKVFIDSNKRCKGKPLKMYADATGNYDIAVAETIINHFVAPNAWREIECSNTEASKQAVLAALDTNAAVGAFYQHHAQHFAVPLLYSCNHMIALDSMAEAPVLRTGHDEDSDPSLPELLDVAWPLLWDEAVVMDEWGPPVKFYTIDGINTVEDAKEVEKKINELKRGELRLQLAEIRKANEAMRKVAIDAAAEPPPTVTPMNAAAPPPAVTPIDAVVLDAVTEPAPALIRPIDAAAPDAVAEPPPAVTPIDVAEPPPAVTPIDVAEPPPAAMPIDATTLDMAAEPPPAVTPIDVAAPPPAVTPIDVAEPPPAAMPIDVAEPPPAAMPIDATTLDMAAEPPPAVTLIDVAEPPPAVMPIDVAEPPPAAMPIDATTLDMAAEPPPAVTLIDVAEPPAVMPIDVAEPPPAAMPLPIDATTLDAAAEPPPAVTLIDVAEPPPAVTLIDVAEPPPAAMPIDATTLDMAAEPPPAVTDLEVEEVEDDEVIISIRPDPDTVYQVGAIGTPRNATSYLESLYIAGGASHHPHPGQRLPIPCFPSDRCASKCTGGVRLGQAEGLGDCEPLSVLCAAQRITPSDCATPSENVKEVTARFRNSAVRRVTENSYLNTQIPMARTRSFEGLPEDAEEAEAALAAWRQTGFWRGNGNAASLFRLGESLELDTPIIVLHRTATENEKDVITDPAQVYGAKAQDGQLVQQTMVSGEQVVPASTLITLDAVLRLLIDADTNGVQAPALLLHSADHFRPFVRVESRSSRGRLNLAMAVATPNHPSAAFKKVLDTAAKVKVDSTPNRPSAAFKKVLDTAAKVKVDFLVEERQSQQSHRPQLFVLGDATESRCLVLVLLTGIAWSTKSVKETETGDIAMYKEQGVIRASPLFKGFYGRSGV